MVAFLYTDIETTPFKTASKEQETDKNLGINLTKAVKDLHAENYKTLITEVEWKHDPHLWARKNIVKTAMPLKNNLRV